jgi:hypothetical protein
VAFIAAVASCAGIDASQEPLFEESLEFEDDAAR